MTEKKKKYPPGPLSQPVVCEIPGMGRKQAGRPRINAIWDKVMQLVRDQNGRTVKICAHPNARNVLRPLNKAYPEFGFITRNIPADRGTTVGVWAWLKAGTDGATPEPPPDPPGVPPPPVDPVLTNPAF